MNDSERNLIDFYSEAGKASSVFLTENSYFTAAQGENGSWPQIIFNLRVGDNPEIELNEILTEASRLDLPHLAVCNIGAFHAQSQTILKECSIFPVQVWTLMELPCLAKNDTKEEKYTFRRIETNKDIEDFTELVNAELLQSTPIRKELVEELASKANFNFYGLFIHGELKSGLLCYLKNNVAGIYFVVTQKKSRGIGLAAELIRFSITELLNKNVKKVVLQAVQKAVPLYQRLGFISCGEVGIFWKSR